MLEEARDPPLRHVVTHDDAAVRRYELGRRPMRLCLRLGLRARAGEHGERGRYAIKTANTANTGFADRSSTPRLSGGRHRSCQRALTCLPASARTRAE